MTEELIVHQASELHAAGFQHAFFACGERAELHAQARGGITHAQVAVSRGRMVRCLAVMPEALHCVRQVHGDRILEVTRGAERRQWLDTEGDALMTRGKGIAVGIVTADCAPLLVADPTSGWVAAAHLGRLGALAGLAGKLVRRLQERGACLETMIFAVGPHIQASSYEVGEAMFAALPLVAQFQDERGRYCCSLKGLIGADLEAVGVRSDQIQWSPLDTFSDHRFFSHRRQGCEAGRQLSAIVGGCSGG